MAYTHMKPGIELEVSERAYFSAETADISALVQLSPEKLKELEEISVMREQAVYGELCSAVRKWEEQAAQTLNYRKAQEYLKICPVDHTSNQPAADEHGWHEISNMVYKFRWRTSESTKWDRAAQKSVPVAWAVSWYLTFNTTNNPDYSGPGRQIAGQTDKKFSEKAAMEKYLQGRIAAYAHLFTEISPPIPEEARRRFCVNGVLLPGYTVDTPELSRPDEKNVDDLLSLLEDGDIPSVPQPEEPEPPPAAPPRRQSPRKARPVRSGPVR